MRYRPEIDGLRAVAVVPVILFHAGFTLFGGGYVGVDIFFVISGYLITTIILSEKAAGTFSLKRFYERRARRIIPALYFVMLCSLPLATVLVFPEWWDKFTGGIVAVIFFVSNFHFWANSGYFTQASELEPFLHTWSLAVEEQFYLFFPLLIMLLWRFGLRVITMLIAVGLLLSLGLSEWASRYYVGANFFLLPTRAWELFIGASAARYAMTKPVFQKRTADIAGALGLALIVYAIFAFDDHTRVPGLYGLVPTVGAVLVILFASSETYVARLLSLRGFVGIGLISYSTYLWHQPLFAFLRLASDTTPSAGMFAGFAVLSLALGWFSWKYVEQPFRRGDKFSQKQIFGYVAIASFAFLALAGLEKVTNAQERYYVSRLHENEVEMYELLKSARQTRRFRVDEDCKFSILTLNAEFQQRFDKCFAEYGPAEIILGDSHGEDMYTAIALNMPKSSFVVGFPKGGCRPYSDDDKCPTPKYYETLREFIAKHAEEVSQVVYHQAGHELVFDAHSDEVGRELFSRDVISKYEINAERIEFLLQYLSELSNDVDVIWLGPRLEPSFSRTQILEDSCDNPKLVPQTGAVEIFENLDMALRTRMETSNVRYISLLSLTEFDPKTDLFDCTNIYWTDGHHWSTEGERRFGARIVPALTAE